MLRSGDYRQSTVEPDEPGASPPDPDEKVVLTTREEAFAELADLNDPSPHPEDASVGRRPDVEAEPEPILEAPPVVAVIVTHNAGDWLDETLESFATQTYDNLSVLVIDAASDIDPTPRIARTLPGAFVRRLEHNVGFGPTLNEVLELVTGASFLCFCHDDVALDPTTVHRLVEEAFRSNAGVVGPKLVDWDDPERLLQVGFTVDKSGGRAPYADRGDLDQEQHDAVRDVFAVPGACTLVRADLFAHLGGFDPGIDLLGEDLDLCWRAHLVGARVVVAPAARVRHREVLTERRPDIDASRVAAAHRVRTVLGNYQLRHLVLIAPQAFVIMMVEAIVDATMGRRNEARSQLAAWGTNLRHLPALPAVRRRVRRRREHNDRSIRHLQTHTWARLGALVQVNRRALADEDDTPRAMADEHRSLVPYGVAAVVLLLVLGTRDLFFGSLPAIGEFARAPGGVGSVWSAWLSGWNPVGLGSTSPAASGLAPMAVAGSLVGGALGFVRRVAILGLLPLGAFGSWRLAKPLGSRRAQLTSLIVYVAIPVPYNALAQGRWSGLVLYAVAPWSLAALARAMRVPPFAEPTDHAGVGPRGWSRALGLGLLLALAGCFVPAVVPVVLVATVGIVFGSLLAGRISGIGRLVLTAGSAAVVAGLLLLPWTLGVIGPGGSWRALAGMRSGTDGWLSLSRIVRFESGPFGAPPLGLAFLVAAALPLVIGRDWRFGWAVRAWGCAVACWAVLWAGQQGWMPIPIPPAEVLLAPAAAALALAVACGMSAFDVDLPGYRFGWRQGLSLLVALAVLAGSLPMIGGAFDGRWKVASADFGQALDFVRTQRAAEPFRVLWIGDPDVVPVAGWKLDDGLVAGVSDDGMPTMTELWAPGDPAGSRALLDAIDLALAGQTTRLGRILATMDVRYVVLPRQIVPLPYRSTAHELPASVVGSLDDQLDFAQVAVNNAAVVYRNDAWHAGLRLLPADAPKGRSVADALGRESGTSVLRGLDPVAGGRGRLDSGGILATGQPADPGWHLTVDGKAATRVTLQGWEQAFVVPKGGEVVLSHRVTPTRPLAVLVVALVWLAAVALWRFGRRSSDDLDLVTEPLPLDPDEGSLIRLGPPGGEDEVVEVDEVRVGESDGDPVGEEPVDAESLDGEPAGREPADREPAAREPVDGEPAAREPVDGEPAAREPVDDADEEPT
jgi:GT2 family glycosyltransferase